MFGVFRRRWRRYGLRRTILRLRWTDIADTLGHPSLKGVIRPSIDANLLVIPSVDTEVDFRFSIEAGLEVIPALTRIEPTVSSGTSISPSIDAGISIREKS